MAATADAAARPLTPPPPRPPCILSGRPRGPPVAARPGVGAAVCEKAVGHVSRLGRLQDEATRSERHKNWSIRTPELTHLFSIVWFRRRFVSLIGGHLFSVHCRCRASSLSHLLLRASLPPPPLRSCDHPSFHPPAAVVRLTEVLLFPLCFGTAATHSANDGLPAGVPPRLLNNPLAGACGRPSPHRGGCLPSALPLGRWSPPPLCLA